MNVDWKLKSRLLSLFDLLGENALYFTQKHISRRAMIDLAKIPKGWAFHKQNILRYRPATLLEFGAGKSLGQNLYISDTGVRQHVVDLNPMLDLSLVNRVIGMLRDRYAFDDFRDVASLGDLETDYGISYEAPVDMTGTGFPDHCFDMCISTNTLEHIPITTIRGILGELGRLLRKDGVISAQIDYSDHYAHTDRRISRLNYLKFSEQDWARHNHNLFYQNRLRHEHYRKLFEEAGFLVLHSDAHRPCKDSPAELDPDLLTGDDSDFCLTGHWILQNR